MHGTLGCPVCGATNIALGSTACPSCHVPFASPVVSPQLMTHAMPTAGATAVAVAPAPATGSWYATPAPANPAAQAVSYASIWRRIGAAIVDSLVLMVPFALFIGPSEYFATETSDDALSWIVPTTGLGFAEAIAWSAYVVLMLSSTWQGTVGMRLLKLRAVTEDGHETVSAGKAALRELATYLSAAILMVGYLMIAFTEKRQALHDKIAGTVVIHDPR